METPKSSRRPVRPRRSMSAHQVSRANVEKTPSTRLVDRMKDKAQGMEFFFVFSLVLTTVTALLHQLVENEVETPYMDEIFHVPQAQRFCKGNFSHDPKITTLPGLYHFSVCFQSVIEAFQIPNWLFQFNCTSLTDLRKGNLIINSVNYCLFHQILSLYMADRSRFHVAFAALVLTLMPLNYFFSLLYYTDQLSTMAVLAMHALYLNDQFWLSAIAGGLSVYTRQTNILWVGWHLGLLLWDKLTPVVPLFVPSFRARIRNGLERPKQELLEVDQEAKEKKKVKKSSGASKKNAKWSLLSSRVLEAFFLCLPYLSLCVLFLAFVYENGGIAIGDKQAHSMTLNLPQLGYFSLFCFVLGFAHLIFDSYRNLKDVFDWSFLWFACSLIGMYLVKEFTYVHEYTLSDNRHYTFYLWKRFLGKPYIKYVLVFHYFFLWLSIFKSLKQHWILKVFYFLVTCLATVPNRLFELRYFILPYYFWRISSFSFGRKELIIEFLIYSFLNVLVIHKFLYMPFKWPQSEDDQRFMW